MLDGGAMKNDNAASLKLSGLHKTSRTKKKTESRWETIVLANNVKHRDYLLRDHDMTIKHRRKIALALAYFFFLLRMVFIPTFILPYMFCMFAFRIHEKTFDLFTGERTTLSAHGRCSVLMVRQEDRLCRDAQYFCACRPYINSQRNKNVPNIETIVSDSKQKQQHTMQSAHSEHYFLWNLISAYIF